MQKNSYNTRHSALTNADSNPTLPNINSTNFSITPSLLSIKAYDSSKNNKAIDYSTRGVYGALAYGGTKMRIIDRDSRKSA